MAYYLTIRKKDTYIPIDIGCLTCFTKLSKYKSGGYIEQTVLKDCYFNTKGRYIKVKGKRVYI